VVYALIATEHAPGAAEHEVFTVNPAGEPAGELGLAGEAAHA